MILYEKGPDAIGAWHPPGYYAMNFREHGRLLCQACAEFKVSTSRYFGK